ncbi:hypothetical protein H7I95_18860 [Mycolicibacterium elephantis]|nr:hypothetical protein [Mycolicibacterium elephantis]
MTFAAGGTLGAEGPTYRRLTVHRIDQPVASGPTFDTADEVRAFLDQLAQLPLWRLDLDDNSIEFDSEELTIRDKATGESFCLKGWSWGVTGRAARGQSAGRYEGATHLSVRSDESPSIGKWYKSDKG